MSITAIGPNVFRVVVDGRTELVYVAGPAGRRWAFWNGQVYREEETGPSPARGAGRGGVQQVTAPMPATVLRVLVTPGMPVSKGDALVIVEAMKMELPLRAFDDAVVKAVRCREGELVQPDALLVELE
ncbi:MAG: acetyl-CoA carboxylase biotin carboxyl carrier protein subunit [Vicinamibacterales bacterium]